MFTGGIFLKGIIDMARNVMSPVHFYVYDYANAHSLNAFYGPCPKHLGVSHGDEIISLFDCAGQRLNARDRNVSALMVDVWTNFASAEYGSDWLATYDCRRYYRITFRTVCDRQK